MKSKSFDGMACSIAGALEAVGDRWGFLILRDLGIGLRRYDDLHRSTGIPHTTLSARLKHLEKSGLLERRPYQDNPPRFEYAPTRKGREFGLVILALAQWGDRWNAAGTGAPPVEFFDRATHRKVRLAIVDAQNGEPVSGNRVAGRPGRGADDVVRWRFRAAEDE